MTLRDLMQLNPPLTIEQCADVLGEARGHRFPQRTLSLWLMKERDGYQVPGWALDAIRAYRANLLDNLKLLYQSKGF